jgi:hypothetical protein
VLEFLTVEGFDLPLGENPRLEVFVRSSPKEGVRSSFGRGPTVGPVAAKCRNGSRVKFSSIKQGTFGSSGAVVSIDEGEDG